MSNIRKSVNAIRDIAGKKDPATYICRVTSVNGASCDVVRVGDEKQIRDVRLNATILEGDGLVITPVVDSVALVTTIDGYKWFVSQYSEIEKIILNVDGIIINGGENGGLCITPALTGELEKMTARIDGIIDAINNAVATPQDGGLGLQTTMKAKLATLLDKEDFSEIENKKIKH
jgi:hypothetical protein